MRALVVFESMFGNTEAIARAVTEGLSSRADVTLVEVGAAPATVGDVDLLVVGGPTHALSLSRPRTRRDAEERAEGPLVSSGTGLREWLAQLDSSQRARDTRFAAFDTRVRKPRFAGSAARAAARRLRRLGFQPAAPATNFYVDGMTGPLLEGERERARRWGGDLAARAEHQEVSRP